MKQKKTGEAPKEHKQPWQEKYAAPEEIKAMLDSRVSLRYNEVRGRTEIHWLSQGPVLREDEQELAAQSGYRNYRTFSLAFRQRMGQSVKEWMGAE